ncbi:hypothetical protein ACWDUL_21355 [Nocardia niigatensis]|uniref:hypothetical protein n=1 Tax=Nocardia niigatensis TaxID=209249 RepID=UPI0003163206|nr:hypothetical protein [Nocardia niigatensis]
MQVIGLSDGSAIVLARVVDSGAPQPIPDEGTLSLPVEAVTWISDAVAAGVTFDVLKAAALGLVTRGWTPAPGDSAASAETVTDTVIRYLRDCGYTDVQIAEIRKVDHQGWKLSGKASGYTFSGLADESGDVIHVRIQ